MHQQHRIYEMIWWLIRSSLDAAGRQQQSSAVELREFGSLLIAILRPELYRLLCFRDKAINARVCVCLLSARHGIQEFGNTQVFSTSCDVGPLTSQPDYSFIQHPTCMNSADALFSLYRTAVLHVRLHSLQARRTPQRYLCMTAASRAERKH